jgi:hypothetical protein
MIHGLDTVYVRRARRKRHASLNVPAHETEPLCALVE